MKIDSTTPAVVTGGASGLGASVAAMLRHRGAPVAILDVSEDSGKATANAMGALFCRADVTRSQSVASALQVARDTHGQERICINCAGIAPAAKTVSRGLPHDLALWSQVIDINLTGTFNVASQSACGMANNLAEGEDRGVIINTASVAGYEGQMGQVAYAASKGGIIGATLPMARDLAKANIRVMAIAPGIFATPMLTAMPQDVQDSLAATVVNPQRLGDPDEYASLAASIIENPYLNGTVIRLDGALRMAVR